MNPISSYEDSSMETVELHRAESLVEPPDDLQDLIINQEQREKQPEHSIPIEYRSKASRCMYNFCTFVKDMKVEMLMFLYMFSYVIRSITSTSMILDKVCLVHLGYPPDICHNISYYPSIKSTAEKMTNNYHLGHSLIQMVPSAILGCFIGVWSDKYGRKLPVIVSLIGIILDGLGSTICAAVMNSRVEYYFIAAVFTGLSGGFISVLMVLYSYASDTSSTTNRTMKYALMEMSFGLAMPLGSFVGGWIFKYLGYVPVFMISTTGHVLGLIWVIFVLKETRGLDVKETWQNKFRDFWSTKAVVESFRTTVKWRPNKGREQILLLMMCMSLSVLSFASSASINFLYVHHLYNWQNTKYSTVSAVYSVMGTIVLLVSVPVFKRLKLGDAALGIAGSVSVMAKSIAIGLSVNEHIYYVANLLGLFSGLATLAGRSRISKVTPKDELGKVFSFLTSAESILPIISTAVVTIVFNLTLDVFPGLIYVVLGLLMISPITVFIWLRTIPLPESEGEQSTSQEGKIPNFTSPGLKNETMQKITHMPPQNINDNSSQKPAKKINP